MNWVDFEVNRSKVKVTTRPDMVTSLVQKCTFPTETQRLIVRRRRHPVGGRNGWVQTSFRRNITAESQPIIYVDELKENIRRICMKQPIGQNTINRALNSGACHILQNSCVSVFFSFAIPSWWIKMYYTEPQKLSVKTKLYSAICRYRVAENKNPQQIIV